MESWSLKTSPPPRAPTPNNTVHVGQNMNCVTCDSRSEIRCVQLSQAKVTCERAGRLSGTQVTTGELLLLGGYSPTFPWEPPAAVTIMTLVQDEPSLILISTSGVLKT